MKNCISQVQLPCPHHFCREVVPLSDKGSYKDVHFVTPKPLVAHSSAVLMRESECLSNLPFLRSLSQTSSNTIILSPISGLAESVFFVPPTNSPDWRRCFGMWPPDLDSMVLMQQMWPLELDSTQGFINMLVSRWPCQGQCLCLEVRVPMFLCSV